MHTQQVSILNLPSEMRYLQIDLTTFIQKRFRPRLLGFWSLPKLKVISEAENRKLTGQDTSLINFASRTIYINVKPEMTPARQWEEALGDTVHENLHDVWDLFPKDEKWDSCKAKLMNIFMDGRNEQYASYADKLCGNLLIGMRKYAFADLESKIKRKQWFDGDPLWASALLSLKIHTGLMAEAPELIYRFQSGDLQPKDFWREVKAALKLRQPPPLLKWKKAWAIICRFWLAGNIYVKSKLADEFRALYPKPQSDFHPETPEDRGGHVGQPAMTPGSSDGEPENGGEGGETRPQPNNIPVPANPKSGDEIEQEVDKEKNPSQCGGRSIGDGLIYPRDGRELEEQSKILCKYLRREVSILMAPKKREVTVSSNRIRMQKVLKNPNTLDPWKKKKETEINTNIIKLNFIGDTSGSMDDDGKLEAMRLALGVFHEVCSVVNGVEHEIYTSVGFHKIADKKWSKSRSYNLLAGLNVFGGDDFERSLPLLFKQLKGGREIVFVFTDGQPCNIARLQETIQKARKGGTIVFGVGLNISGQSDRNGMETLFGEDKLLATINQGAAEDFARQMACALRNLVRRRLLN